MRTNYYIFVLISLCVVACSRHDSARTNRAPMKVQTIVVSPQSGISTSRYVGTIEPVRETPLSIQTAGRVVSVAVKNGQRVSKGQILLEVDNTQALNALKGSEASFRHAEDGYSRAKKVHDKGVVSDQKMVEIESQYNQAKSLYEAAKQQLKECTLVAPCDGVVSGLEVEKGQSLLPGTKVCSVLDVSGFSVRFTVPETEISAITTGSHPTRGEAECAAVNGTYPIVIKEKSVTANPVTHTYEVVASIEGNTSGLMSGMVAKVKLQSSYELQSGEPTGEIIIPAKCVLLKPEGHTVWVIEQGRAVRRPIVIGGYRADGVRVLSGLQTGDTLITEGYQKLYNDCNVIFD